MKYIILLFSFTTVFAQNESTLLGNYVKINGVSKDMPTFQTGLGTFTCNTPLILNGLEAKTSRCGTCSISKVSLWYRVYKTGTTPEGFSEITTSNPQNPTTNAGCIEENWDNLGHNANLLNGLQNGTYTLEIYFQSTGIACQPNELTTATFTSNFVYYKEPTIVFQPIDLVNCTGLDMYFKTNATGLGTLSYKWQRSDNGGAFTDLTATTRYVDVTTKTLKINNIITDNHDDLFRCVITDASNGCSITTRAASAFVSRKSTVISTVNTICEGSTNKLTSNILAGTVNSYQWQYRVGSTTTYNNLAENLIFTGTTTSELSISKMPLDISRYRVEMNFNTIEMDNSGNAVPGTCRLTENEDFTVNPRPIKPAAIASERCGSGSITLNAPSVYSGYKWYADTTQTAVATTSSYSPTLTNSQTYFFGYLSANNCESFRSEAKATIHPLPTITIGNIDGQCPGSNSFTIPFSAATNTDKYSVTSSIAGFTPIMDANLATSPITVPIPSNLTAGTYNLTLKLKNASTSCVSADIPLLLKIKQPTTITEQPASQTNCLGNAVSIQVRAVGEGTLAYQWFKGGNPISGKTASELSFSSVTLADAGDYTCRITGECGVETSAIATLTIKAQTLISQHPQNSKQCEGASATFTILASGEGTLSYQWKKNGVPIGGNSNSLTISNLLVSDNSTKISCDVTADCGITPSNEATLTVVPLPNSPAILSTVGYCQGETTSALSATPTAGNSLLWWGQSASGGTSSSTAPLPLSSTVGSTIYYVSQQTVEGCESPRVATTVIISNPLTASTSASQSAICGKGVINTTALVGTVARAGNGSFSYEWRNSSGVMAGKTTDIITVNAADTYTVKVSSAYCSVENSITLNSTSNELENAPTAADVGICYATDATLIASSEYTNGSFKWYDVANGTIPISANNPYVITNLTANKTVYVAYQKANGLLNCETPRKAVTVSVNSALSFSQHPSDLTNCKGNTLTFVAANPTATSFQWQRKIPNGVFENINGETTASLRITNVGSSTNPHLTKYRVIATNGSCTATSNEATLSVNSVTKTATESDKTLCSGTNFTLNLNNYAIVGTVSSFQWQFRNGTSGSWVDIAGGNNNTLTINNLQATNTGYYRCKITFTSTSGTCIEYNETGNGVKLTISDNPNPIITANKTTVCGSESSSLTINSCAGTVNWSNGQTGSSINVSAGTYSAKCTLENCESEKSNEIIITSSSLPSAPIIAADKTILCDGESATLTTISCTSGTVLWSNGSTGITIQVNTGASYTATCSNSCGTSPISNTIKISANVTPNGGVIDAISGTNCSGYNPPEIVNKISSTGSDNEFQWQQRSTKGNWVDIIGAISETFNPSTLTDTTLYRRKVTNLCGIGYSNVDTIYIAPDPTVSVSTLKTLICSNETFSISSTIVGGSGNCPISWQQNDRSNAPTSSYWVAITGNDNTLTISNLANTTTETKTVYYRAIVDCLPSSCNKATSEGIGISVAPSFEIALNISDSTICEGNTVALIASGCGGTLSWTSGQTTATISVSPLSTTSYTATCSNSCGSSSKTARITVRAGGIALPVSTTPSGVVMPTILVFSASGNSLKWYDSASGGVGYTIPPTHSSLGTYTHWVTQSDGFCESNRLKIISHVYPPLQLTFQNENKYDCKGNSEYFSVGAIGAGKLRYQWQRKRPNETQFTDLTYDGDGITFFYGPDLRVSAIGNTNNPHLTKFRCIVRDSLGVVTSNEMTLHVNSLQGTFPNIGACIGGNYDENIKTRFVITGNVASYQWQKRGGTSGAWNVISDNERLKGSTTEQLKISPLNYDDSQYYRCAVKFNTGGVECIETTDPSRLIVSGYPPTPTGFDVTYCQYETAKKLVFKSNPDNDILWYSTDNQQYGDKTAPTPSTIVAGQFNVFITEITAEGCESPKGKINVTINPKPLPPISSTPVFIKQGTPLVFTANGTNLKWFTSRTGRTYTTESPVYTAPKTYEHYVSQTSQFGCESDRTFISSTIRQALAFTKTPTEQADCDGNSVSFEANALGWGNVSYQWQKINPTSQIVENLAGETAKKLTIKNIGEGENQDGTLYRCRISDSEDTLVSTPVKLVVNRIIGTVPNVSICEGATIKLDTTKLVINGLVVNYEWQRQDGRSWESINNGNSKWLDLGIADATKQADYRLKVEFKVNEKTTCNRYTSETKVVVNPKPKTPKSAAFETCKSSVFNLVVQPSEKKNSIIWYNSLKDSLGKTTLPKIDSKTDFQTYFVTEKGANGCESERSEITLKFLPTPPKPLSDSTLTICQFAENRNLSAISDLKLLWSENTSDDFQEGTPTLKTNKIGEAIYYVAALDSKGCLSEAQKIKAVIQPCVFTDASISNEACISIRRNEVKGNEWHYFFDPNGNLFAAINPENQDLGDVTMTFKLYNSKELLTANKISYLPRYFNFSSSKTSQMARPISIRFFVTNEEIKHFDPYKAFTIVQYEGINSDCDFYNNDNFKEGKSVVIYEKSTPKKYSENSSFIEFQTTRFSEFGVTQNEFSEIQGNVSAEGENVVVAWTVSKVINPLRYLVERSQDSKTWFPWREIKKENDTKTVDLQPFSNELYYRIVYQDQDGTLKYFKEMNVKLSTETPVCTVFPNPIASSETVQLFTRNFTPTTFEFYDVAFKQWGVSVIKTEPNTYALTLSSALAQGTYFVRIIDEKENSCVVKLIKR